MLELHSRRHLPPLDARQLRSRPLIAGSGPRQRTHPHNTGCPLCNRPHPLYNASVILAGENHVTMARWLKSFESLLEQVDERAKTLRSDGTEDEDQEGNSFVLREVDRQ